MAKSQARKDHEQDMQTLARMLLDAAKRNGLCGVFYEEVARINEELTIPLDLSETKPFRVTMSVSFNTPLSGTSERWGGFDMDEAADVKLQAIADAIEAALTSLATNVEVSVEDWNEV